MALKNRSLMMSEPPRQAKLPAASIVAPGFRRRFPRFSANKRIIRTGLGLTVLMAAGWNWAVSAPAQVDDKFEVKASVAPGAYLVGQGFELHVGVVANQRPRVELPPIAGAVGWKIGVEERAISTTGIGSILARESVFLVRFRVVAERAGTLEIPSLRVQVGKGSGHSQPIRVNIRPVPLPGRTVEFLGGVGEFALAATASPGVIRVGQELEYRIKVRGPAAWGMNGHPELTRFNRLRLGLRIESRPDETTEEPPERTFVYRLRPTRAGEAVLPPVAIAAFDPTLSRYVTRATSGVPIRVVAVPAFDPASIDGDEPQVKSSRSAWAAGICSGFLLAAASAAIVWVRGRTRRRRLHGPVAARRFAARLARSYVSAAPVRGRRRRPSNSMPADGKVRLVPEDDAAQRASDELMQYLEIGLGRPPGALTPGEVWQGVADLTGSQDLAGEAGQLAARCDRVLYGARSSA